MRTLVVDGSGAGDVIAPRVREAVAALRPQTRFLTVRDLTIGNCAGDFFCWVRSPGRCNVGDDNRVVAAEMMASDVVVLLTPVTFGGYSARLKQAVDHLIPNISPFFARRAGETHHRRRYRRYPDLVALGWLPEPDARSEQVFRTLVARNGINFCSPRTRCDVLVGDLTAQQVSRRVRDLLQDAPADGGGPVPPSLTAAARVPAPVQADGEERPAARPRRVVLLTGSPRTATSNSHFLNAYLGERLGGDGADVEELQIYTTMASTRRRPAALAKLDAADLVVLASPLYVDALPAPVVAALEHWRQHRAGRSTGDGPRLVALLNCGFPEPGHNATALAIAQEFARRAGLRWSGGLALGGGEAVVGRRPLAAAGRAAAPLRTALDLTASALTAGHPVPPSAIALLDRAFVPPWLYRTVGQVSWVIQARAHGAVRHLLAQPHRRPATAERHSR